MPDAPIHQSAQHLDRIVVLLGIIGIALAIAFCFFASSVCITLLLSGFLAILVDPVITRLESWHISRAISSAVVIISGLLVIASLFYAFYGKTADVVEALPDDIARIRESIKPITRQIEKMQDSAGNLGAVPSGKKVPEVRVKDSTPWPSYLMRGIGSVWGAIVIAAVVPFLMFFLLLRKHHLYSWLLNTFGTNTDIPSFVKRTTQMVQSFAVGNAIIGSLMAAATVAVLLAIKLDGAIGLGIVSGFLNIVPFVGVPLAAAVPFLAAALQFSTAGPFFTIIITVVALHLISSNLLIPKLIGSRIDIGPVAATVGILFWGWLWGVPGILLAVPLTALVKLIADCCPSLLYISNLLAEEPRAISWWKRSRQSALDRPIPLVSEHPSHRAKP